jgi:lipoprotein-anchoring transpeptidase ErfK/SrfK
MQRLVLPAIIAAVTFSTAPANAQEPNFGGGFLELLFRGPPGFRDAAPRYEPYQRQQVEPGAPEYSGRPDQYEMDPRYLKQVVHYDGREPAGTIIINTNQRYLYLVQGDGSAIRYGIGVGRPGFTWAGVHHVTRKREWPDWTPPADMLRRRPDLPRHMEGGPENPLGARAMYLGSTLYRIHGSNEPWTIGTAVSSGCIRMRNEDVIDLYQRVKVGTKVVVS